MKNKIYLIPESAEEVRVLSEELKLPMFTLTDIRHTSGPLRIHGRYECTMEQFETIQQRINQISNVPIPTQTATDTAD